MVGRSRDSSCYQHDGIRHKGTDYLGEVNYPQAMNHPWFIQGIHQLLKSTEQQTTSIMCSEEDPAHSHRHHLIAKYLMSKFPEATIMHIRWDGSFINAKSIHTSMDQSDAKQLSY